MVRHSSTGSNLSLSPSDALVIAGPSGSGKTTLLRTLAGLWPWCDGEAAYPAGDRTMFLPQMPYMPLGALRTALAYPASGDRFSDDRLREVLRDVQLAHLSDRIDDEEAVGSHPVAG